MEGRTVKSTDTQIEVEISEAEVQSINTKVPSLLQKLQIVRNIETINDTKTALAMMNSAAARAAAGEACAMETLGLSPDQVIEKYTQFVGSLGGSFSRVLESITKDLTDISTNLATLDDNKTQELQNKLSLMNTIIGSLLRLVPGGSIGSLSGGTDGITQRQIDALKKWQNKFQDIQNQIKNLGNSSCKNEEIAEIVQSLSNISIMAEVKNIQDAIGPSISAPGCANFLLQDFRIIQFIATGVDLLEKLNGQSSQGFSEAIALYNELNNNSCLGAYGDGMDFMKTVRQSGFFMEYSYKKLDEQICNTFVKQVANKLGLDDAQQTTLKDAIDSQLKHYRDAAGGSDRSDIKGGFRGRDVSTQINGHQKPTKKIYLQQGPAEIRGKPVSDFLTLDRLQGSAVTFFDTVNKNGGFNRPSRPQQSATPDVIEPHRVAMLNDPVGFLQSALRGKGVDLSTPPFNQLATIQKSLQDALLNTEFSIAGGPSQKGDHPWKIIDLVEQDTASGKYISKPSFAASMIDRGLQTFCSISGTTTDIVVGLVAQPDGKAKMTDTLGPLVELLEKAVVAVPPLSPEQLADKIADNPNLNGFKDLFLSVSLYMQSGQYHTASEVLAGLYCAALNVCPVSDPLSHPPATDVEAFGERFERLCTAFQSNPAAFFPATTSQRQAA
jgi:hypothetical protein